MMDEDDFEEADPRYCLHKMAFSDRFAVCEACGQTWEAGDYGWNPVDQDRSYRGKPKFNNYRRRKKK